MPSPNLSDAYLFGFRLASYDLSGAGLRRSNLRRARLDESNLEASLLDGASLEEAVVAGASLRKAQISRTDFFGVNGSSADFQHASARHTGFINAKLTKAHFEAADLSDANFRGADLQGASFRRAHLSGVNFHRANLRDADFSEATIGNTIFSFSNVERSKNLETVRHSGPSVIDVDTLLTVQNWSEQFLRGVGLPEIFMSFRESMAAAKQPIQFYSCFISHSSKDAEFCGRLHADLQNHGVRCWFSPEELKIGDRFRSRIEESIRVYDKLLLVLSAHSIESRWVEDEVEAALEREGNKTTVLFPVRLDEAVMEARQAWAAAVRRSRHIGDFVRWKEHDEYSAAFKRLLRDLKTG